MDTATKDEFYRALDRLADAAVEAHKKMPSDIPDRHKRLWTSILSRLPEQIQDTKENLDNPPQFGRSSGIIV